MHYKKSWIPPLLKGTLEHLPLRIKATLPLYFHRSATESTPAQLISDTTARRTAGSKRKRSENGDEVEKALLLRQQTLQQQQDGEAAFVEHVAASLRQLNPRERAIAKIEIDKILFKVQYSEDVL